MHFPERVNLIGRVPSEGIGTITRFDGEPVVSLPTFFQRRFGRAAPTTGKATTLCFSSPRAANGAVVSISMLGP
jgi:hypothetical protein